MEEIIIIGGGLMGSSVAWKLAEQGENVRLIEQQAEVYDHGSSYGAARIARSLGPKRDVFSFVHNRTITEVKKLIAFLNKEGASDTHHMDDVYNTSPVSYIYSKDQYEQLKKLRHKKQRKDYRRGSGDSAFRKFGVSLKPDETMVREMREYSGTFNPQALILKLREAIKIKNGNIQFNSKVTRLVKVDGNFELEVLDTIKGDSKIIKAKKIIVAAGPYTVGLLKDFAPYLNRVIVPKRVLLSYFKIAKEQYDNLTDKEKKNLENSQPVFSQLGKEYFSLIERWDDGIPVFKIGGHRIRKNVIDVDAAWDSKPQKKEFKWNKKQFKKYLKRLEIYLKKKEIELVSHYNCMYSMTRNEVPLVSHIFNRYGSLDKNIVLIGGMSGVGAKGCLGYGTIGANLILGNPEESSKVYRKAVKAFGNPSVRLHTRRPRNGRLF